MTATSFPAPPARRSGTQWVLSPLSVLLSAPLWVVGLVANEHAAYGGPQGFTQTLAISALAYAVMASVLLLADRLPVVRGLRGMRAYFVIGAIVVLAAELRLMVFVAAFGSVGLPNDVPLGVRAVSSALIALIGYGYAAVALESWARYRDERDRLLVSVLDTTRRVEGHDAAVSAMSAILRQTVQGHLAQARPEITHELDALKSALAQGKDGKAELERLHTMTDDRWRSISAEVWARATAPAPQPGWREFATAYALTRPFSPPAVLMGAAALAFLVFGRALDSATAAGALALWLLLAALVSRGTGAVIRHRPGLAVAAVAAAMLVILAFPVWLVALGLLNFVDIETLIRISVINVNVVAVLMLAGASPAMARNREAVLAALRHRHDDTSVHQLQVESRLLGVAHELAATLHGSSRSTFLAAALRLEAALDHGQSAVALNLVEELRHTIFAAEDSLDDSRPAATAADLDTVIDNWRSVCSIDVDGSWHDVSPQLMPDVHTVVVEAISDAMRHGDCAEIAITVRATATRVVLMVANDGRPMHTPGQAGIGTALLDRLAPGDWSRGVDGDGRTRLTVTVRQRSRR